jgi:hypothetical protein
MMVIHQTDEKYKLWKEGKNRLFKGKYTFRIKIGSINGTPTIHEIKEILEL